MASKTTFIMVPGAWHRASAYELTAERLRAAGYNVTVIELPTCGAEPPLENFDQDVDCTRKAIEEAADKGQDVAVLMHSYGGIVGASSCRGLGKKQREASGKTGGVVKLVYCSAFIVSEGVSVMDVLKKKLPWFIITDNGARLSADTPGEMFYNDLSREEAQKWSEALTHHSFRALSSKSTYAAYKDIPTTYIYCTKDNALPIFAQEKMVEDVRDLGVSLDTETLEASHSPFLSMLDVLVAACSAAIGDSL